MAEHVVSNRFDVFGRDEASALQQGVARDRIILDPGIGFGKTLEHNLALMRAVPQLKGLGYHVMVGVSRKSMFKGLLGIEDLGAGAVAEES